jgi:hypothetical protein
MPVAIVLAADEGLEEPLDIARRGRGHVDREPGTIEHPCDHSGELVLVFDDQHAHAVRRRAGATTVTRATTVAGVARFPGMVAVEFPSAHVTRSFVQDHGCVTRWSAAACKASRTCTRETRWNRSNTDVSPAPTPSHAGPVVRRQRTPRHRERSRELCRRCPPNGCSRGKHESQSAVLHRGLRAVDPRDSPVRSRGEEDGQSEPHGSVSTYRKG